MEQFRPPSPLLLTGNLSETWRRWEQRFQLYMTASGALEKDEKVKTAILLHTIGEEALEVYNTLTITPAGDAPTMAEILKAFRDYCSPQKNVVFERHQFWSHPMLTAITVDRYVTELRQKSKNCEFGANEDDMIRDKLVFSINDTRLKERLLRDNDLTLHKSILGGRACEELQLVKRVETVAVTSSKLTKPPATKEELVERYTYPGTDCYCRSGVKSKGEKATSSGECHSFDRKPQQS
ncbi:hypothetical protein WMY93_002244 [Mugilogobius chulae]|uniref:Gag protein n=1 Tax=Mugilogobius chulae TaxID=88201 RepID=A0AAW0PTB8_9GOBI